MIVTLEGNGKRAFHADCEASRGAIMQFSRNPDDDKLLDDGSYLPFWTCLACGEQCWCGVQISDRRIVTIKELE